MSKKQARIIGGVAMLMFFAWSVTALVTGGGFGTAALCLAMWIFCGFYAKRATR